jgi:hypothetical protein
MKVGEFQKEVNITPDAYSRFMSQHEKDKGSKSSVYLVAWAFFKTREIQGIKTTPNKKARSSQGPAKCPYSVSFVTSLQESYIRRIW